MIARVWRAWLLLVLATVIVVVDVSAVWGQTKDQGGQPKTNRLAKETSPYLLSHAHNPVDWHPWGDEAFALAKKENKPIFLSVGYSSCYWCHVMERESFMNPHIAKYLNEHFVCIKVDREERPDIDQVYMTALQAFGRGGWPMSLFLTSDGRPFFGGTYFPPSDREDITGFPRVLELVATAWKERRKELDAEADNLAKLVRRVASQSAVGDIVGAQKADLARDLAAGTRSYLSSEFDPDFGGFGYDPETPRRPKFPEPPNLLYLLDQHRRKQVKTPQDRDPLDMVLVTLDHMSRGGIRDQLAGGYHRYSVGRQWVVPHFEKMLYDNAQLASVLIQTFEITKDARWKREAEQVFEFVERSLTTSEGAFMSALDAETEKEEGKAYLWTKEEIRTILGDGEDFRVFAQVYGLMRKPNFDSNRYVLIEPRSRAEQAETLNLNIDDIETRLVPARAKILAVREKRPAPFRDDKILTSWNALMIAAYADAARIFQNPRYQKVADTAADFVLNTLKTKDGQLLRTYRAGQAKLPAYLEDYAFLTDALLRLHQASGDPRRLTQARELADRMIKDFSDPQGGFFYTSNNHETLLARPKDPQDGVLPSGNSVAIRGLVELARLTKDKRYSDQARSSLEAFAPLLKQRPGVAPLMLVGLEEYLDLVGTHSLVKKPTTPNPDSDRKPKIVEASAKQVDDPPQSIKAGARFQARVHLQIKDGWHIYANPPGSPLFKPTVVELGPSASKQAKLIAVVYPKGERYQGGGEAGEVVSIYRKTETLVLDLELSQDLPAGDLELPIQIRYQPCDDMACLAPATLEIPLKLTVSR